MILADILQRCDRQRFILIGHSLGCRVLYSCLQTLATTEKKRVASVRLFAGAVHRGSLQWEKAAEALAEGGRIHNYCSDADMVLRLLYRAGTFFQSEPIGRHRIVGVSKVTNHDLSALKIGHMEYLRRLDEIPAAE